MTAAFALDLGTTNIDARLYRLSGETVFSDEFVAQTSPAQFMQHATCPNPQSLFGKDIVSRINAAVRNEKARGKLTSLLREKVVALVTDMAAQSGGEIAGGVLVGNTAMLHFWCALDVGGLAAAPFKASSLFGKNVDMVFGGAKYPVYLPPCLGPFLGADLVAAVVHLWRETQAPFWVLDLGTNCEIAYFDWGRLIAASVAAGPAFASELGQGSELIAKASEALYHGVIDQSGLLVMPRSSEFSQKDVRNLQLAKGAVAAAIIVLLSEAERGKTKGDPQTAPLYLCGAFGDAVRETDARRIGLVPDSLTGHIRAAGNGALDGAGDMVLHQDARMFAENIAKNAVTVDLGGNTAFEKAFLGSLNFSH